MRAEPHDAEPGVDGRVETLDDLARELQHLRLAAGGIAYSELAAQITRIRMDRGEAPAAARVPKSSVYDAFRLGRSRTNAHLVSDVVLALTADADVADRWRQRCARAVGSPPPAAVAAMPAQRASWFPITAEPFGVAFVISLVVACIGINVLGNGLATKLHLPLFLDMIGTAIAAVVLGPWLGALVGLLGGLLGAFVYAPDGIAFVLVNVVGALIWGFGIRRWRLGRSLARYVALTLLTALTCTIVAVPITLWVYGGVSTNAYVDAFAVVTEVGTAVWTALLPANLAVSVIDKLIAGGIALLAWHGIRRRPTSHQGSVLR